MGWKEILEKIKLADIQASLKIGKGSLVNVKVEKNEYNFNLPDKQSIRGFQTLELTPDFEVKVKADVERR